MTPGPWTFVPEPDGWEGDMGGFFGPKGEPVCTFGDSTQYYPTEGSPPDADDARLIVAAPDHLTALREIAALRCGVPGHSVAVGCRASAIARAAIDKAGL